MKGTIMPKKEEVFNPYENIEILTKVVIDNIRTIEQHNYKINENDFAQFLSLVKISMSMNKAMVSDLKSKDAALKGFIHLTTK
jgi:hypothetical protein